MDKLIPDPPAPPLHLDIAADANAERVIDSYHRLPGKRQC